MRDDCRGDVRERDGGRQERGRRGRGSDDGDDDDRRGGRHTLHLEKERRWDKKGRGGWEQEGEKRRKDKVS